MTRGTVYDYVRDDRFNASNPLSGTKLPMHQSQYGASIGGPLAADRTFYFGNVEQRRLDQSGLTTIAPVNAAAINARLSATGYRGPMVETGVYDNPLDTTNALVRVDHQVSGRDQLAVRYSLYDAGSTHSRGAGGLTAPSASQGIDNLDQTIAISNALTLSPRTVLESRAQVAFSDLESLPTDLVGPSVTIAGVATFGRLSTSPTGRQNTMVQAVNNLSHQAGAHALGPAWTYFSTTTRSRFRERRQERIRSRRSLPSSPAPTTTPGSRRRSARPASHRPTRTWASTRRTSGRPATASRSTSGSGTNCSGSRPFARTRTTWRHGWASRGRRQRRAGPSSGPAEASTTIGFRCAPSPTHSSPPATRRT